MQIRTPVDGAVAMGIGGALFDATRQRIRR
jgi:hypothetical protein